MSAKCNNKGASKCGKTSWSLSDVKKLCFFSEGFSMLKWFLSLTFVIPEWQPPEAVPWYYPGQSGLPCDLRFCGNGALHASDHQRKQVQDYPRHQVWPQTHFYFKISSHFVPLVGSVAGVNIATYHNILNNRQLIQKQRLVAICGVAGANHSLGPAIFWPSAPL